MCTLFFFCDEQYHCFFRFALNILLVICSVISASSHPILLPMAAICMILATLHPVLHRSSLLVATLILKVYPKFLPLPTYRWVLHIGTLTFY